VELGQEDQGPELLIDLITAVLPGAAWIVAPRPQVLRTLAPPPQPAQVVGDHALADAGALAGRQ
jgi:hypothetical protein